MALLIDPPFWPAHGRLWSHLVSDTSLDELHAFAAGLGVPERGFEGDHYDLPEELYAAALAAGAAPVDSRTLLGALQASGLRIPKRRGERGLARVRGVSFADDVVDVDLIASPRVAAGVFGSLVFARHSSGAVSLGEAADLGTARRIAGARGELRPVGYEVHRLPGGGRTGTRQAYLAELPATAAMLGFTSVDAFAERSRHLFWWPLAEWALSL